MNFIEESTMSHAELLAWAKEQQSWPSRRYRVEGTYVGNTHLLTEKVAKKEQVRLRQGNVVEAIPKAPSAWTK